MSSHQAGAPVAAEQPGVSPTPKQPMQSSQPRGRSEEPGAPRVQAAFGSGGGAAIVFRDLASI